VLGTLLVAAAGAWRAGEAPRAPDVRTAEAKAIEYLAREVPRWRNEHACYSCHNNGDAARALVVALQRKHTVRAALDDTLAWLSDPRRWDSNPGGEGGGDDKRLARIQFATAALAAADALLVPRSTIDAAAAIVARDQRADGSWRLDSSTSLGSPATYGTPLATALALRLLTRSQLAGRSDRITRGNTWMRSVNPDNVPDASAVILAANDTDDAPAHRQRLAALEFLRRTQGRDGGWGAYPTTASEPFDTGIALQALVETSGRPGAAAPVFATDEIRSSIARGREYLIREQLQDGSWPETTRPARQESYAQRISTTAWAVLALMRD
jgi:squalene-hopene cyclase-like protein